MTRKQLAALSRIVENIAYYRGLSVDLVILALTYQVVENEIVDQVSFLNDEAALAGMEDAGGTTR